MDDKELLVHIKQAQLQAELALEAAALLDRAITQLHDWSGDWDYQRRACEDLYDAVHLLLIHTNQLSRIFWPAKCCGEQGLELCHRAMALREEIGLPDLNHPLRNEILWRHAQDLDHSVLDTHSARRYKAHHLTGFNQVITWMDNEAMLCWLEPNTKVFVFHTEEFYLPELIAAVQLLHQRIHFYLDKHNPPSVMVTKPETTLHQGKRWL